MYKSKRRVLVIGGTGAMGVYLIPELLRLGYSVDVLSLDYKSSANPNLVYYTADALKDDLLFDLLKTHYDAVIDFMIYPTEVFSQRSERYLSATGQYIYLSSYRVYADQQPITESSPQLLDISKDAHFLSSDDYSLRKSRGEDILETSPYKNWTIVRPAITYSKRRFQLVTLEGRNFVSRALAGKKVLVPKEALEVQATMTWAGDVAKMLSALCFNSKALSDDFIVATSEHHTWREIASYYTRLIGLEIEPVDKETFLSVIQPDFSNLSARWQLEYDRLYDRIIDNSKILTTTGLSQNNFMPLFEGLQYELSALQPYEIDLITGSKLQSARMDTYFSNI